MQHPILYTYLIMVSKLSHGNLNLPPEEVLEVPVEGELGESISNIRFHLMAYFRVREIGLTNRL